MIFLYHFLGDVVVARNENFSGKESMFSNELLARYLSETVIIL